MTLPACETLNLISQGYKGMCKGLNSLGREEQSAIAWVRGRWRLSWAERRGDTAEGGENEREEGIERETMGARGTSRHTHTYTHTLTLACIQPIICSRSGHTHTQEHTNQSFAHVSRTCAERKAVHCQIVMFFIYKASHSLLKEDFCCSLSPAHTHTHSCAHICTLLYWGSTRGPVRDLLMHRYGKREKSL